MVSLNINRWSCFEAAVAFASNILISPIISAKAEYERALELCPQYEDARDKLKEINKKLK